MKGRLVQYRVFQYPLPADPDLEDLNEFLAGHRVATVNQQIVSTSAGAMLVFVVQTSPTPADSKRSRSTPRIDYREVLSDREFQIFSQLRDQRKELADEEGVPVYTIFTNAQLAEMVQKKISAAAELTNIRGVGNSRAEKYGAQMVAILCEALREDHAEKSTGGES